MHMTIEGQALPAPKPGPIFEASLPATGGYRRIEISMDRSERLGWLRVTVCSYEAYNDNPVRIEVAPLRKFAHILRDRYGMRGIDLVLLARAHGASAALLAEMQIDLSYSKELAERANCVQHEGQLELMEVGA